MEDFLEFVGIVATITLVILGGASLAGNFSSKQDIYEIQCRASGGTPVFNSGGINCAKEGFIDLHFE